MGRVVVVTGAGSGIGKAAAVRFADAGFRVVMAVRDPARAEAAHREVVAASGGGDVRLAELDVSSQRSIRAFAAAFRAAHPRLDVLIHNAAYFLHGEPFRRSEDGIELAFATNVAGPYLLTRELLDPLRAAPDARVLLVGSNIVKHFFDPGKALDLSDLRGVPGGARPRSVYERYCQTKMALLLLGFALARELPGISVLHLQVSGARMSPETIAKLTWPYRAVARLQNLRFPPTDAVAADYLELGAAERFRGVSGKSFGRGARELRPAPGGKVGLRQQLRQLAGDEFYPALAADVALQEHVLAVCREVTGA